MKTNPSDPAFSPTLESVGTPFIIIPSGLTKRELFAAIAMQGFVASGKFMDCSRDDTVVEAVRWANSLIAALNADAKKEEE